MRAVLSIIFLLAASYMASAQSLFEEMQDSEGKGYSLGGFVRSGIFINQPGSSPGIPVSFADLSLNTETGDGINYKAYADLRYRYGSEYGNTVNRPVLREAWAAWYTPYTELKAGKQFLKWSRMDFFRLTDNVSPRNDLYRSFDPADRYLSNISVGLQASLSEKISLQALLIPRYRPSVIYTEFMDLPGIIDITDMNEDIDSPISYGLRAEFFLRNFSAGINYFYGYRPGPGLGLDSISPPAAGSDPHITIIKKPFRISTLSGGFEFTAGRNIIRTEAVWTDPVRDHRQEKHIMFPEISWAAGIERLLGDLLVLAEYSGKYICGYEEPAADPVLPEQSAFEELAALPPEQVSEYIDLRISSFNRLYNYQLEEYYHFAGLRLSYEKDFALLTPSLNILYNITAGEYMIRPVLSISPSDNLEIMLGAGIYQGNDNSLFNMISDSISSLYTGLRIEF